MNDTKEIFLINQSPTMYRWLSIVEDKNDWGLKLASLKGTPVQSGFGPVKVKWSPETAHRPLCDFPNFRTNIICLSENAREVFLCMLDREGRWIELYGLREKYVAYQSVTVVDAWAGLGIDGRTRDAPDINFHSPRFAPTLHLAKIPGANAFRIPESISKIFVSAKFKRAYDENRLTGLEFMPVRLI